MKSFLYAGMFTILVSGIIQCQTTADRRIAPIVTHKKLALLIGNAVYRNQQPLANPQNDARAMGQRLQELGFDVDAVLDADRKAMGNAIDQFVNKIGTGDLALFYYSGHGMQVEGENYLVPVDYESRDESDAKYDGIPASRIQERMERRGAQLTLLIFDACRNNPFHSSARGVSGGLAAMSPGKGTFIAFAAAPGSTASDNPRGRNGLFTQYLLEALSVPGLGLNDLFDLVREKVDTASRGRQLPWALSSVVGRFSFIPAGRGTAAPVSLNSANHSPVTSAPGNPLTEQAEALLKGKQFAEAFPLLERACAANDQNACISVGWMYIMGNGTGADAPRGTAVLKHSCDSGSAEGCTNVGLFYRLTGGISESSTARSYLSRGCDGGNSEGCGNLANLYRVGWGGEKDVEKARQLYKKACSLGDKDSCDWVERMQ